jgi:3-deoxy-D-manno-octulosonate 8-phosphate phosphatase (KDO 8-P phosphatase)
MERKRMHHPVKENEDLPLIDIKHIFCDVDGVLTDSTKTYDIQGTVISKPFSDLDTMGFSILKRLPPRITIQNLKRKNPIVIPTITLVSGDSRINREFAADHSIPFEWTHTNSKIDICMTILGYLFPEGVTPHEVLYIGNDVNDLECLRSFTSACPSDALPYIQKICDYVTERPGGKGAFREILDDMLFEKGVTLDDYLCCLTPYRHFPEKTIHEIREERDKEKLDEKRNGCSAGVLQQV